MHMNIYKAKQGQAGTGPVKTQEVKELKGELRPAPPYPSRVKTVDKGTQVTPERDAVRAPLTTFNVDVMLSECKKSVVRMVYFCTSDIIIVFMKCCANVIIKLELRFDEHPLWFHSMNLTNHH